MHSIRLKNPTVQPIWWHSNQALRLWICCIFIADPDGVVRVVPSILAEIAKLSPEDFAQALAELSKPEEDNANEPHLKRVRDDILGDGFRVVRYEDWTADPWKEKRLKRNREAVARSRARAKAKAAAKAAP